MLFFMDLFEHAVHIVRLTWRLEGPAAADRRAKDWQRNVGFDAGKLIRIAAEGVA